MKYRFVRGDYSDPNPSQWVALPLSLIPILLLISLIIVPPSSVYSELTLEDDPGTPSGYRIDGAPSCLLEDKQFEKVPFTAWEELDRYYRVRRKTWDDEEYHWFINTVYEVNNGHPGSDGENPDSIWIPSLRAECEVDG